MDTFLDAALTHLLPLLDSWLFVHALLALPFLLMLTNFLRGGCDVARAAGVGVSSSSPNSATPPMLWVALTALAFAWQVHAVWFVAIDLESATMALESLHAVGCLAFLCGVAVCWKRAADERRAHVNVASYEEYAAKAKTHKEQQNNDDDDDYIHVSFCRICQTPVTGREHHCGWLSVCIGARSRLAFWFTMAAAALFSGVDVVLGILVLLPIQKQEDRNSPLYWYLLVGTLFALASFVFVARELVTQSRLMLRGETKLMRWRRLSKKR